MKSVSETRYYRVETRRLRLRELRKIGRLSWPSALLTFALLRAGRVRLAPNFLPRARRPGEWVLPANELPEAIGDALRRMAAEALALGFVEPTFEASESFGTRAGVAGAAHLRSLNGRTVFIAVAAATSTRANASFALLSFVADGFHIATAERSAGFDRPPGTAATEHPGATLAQLVAIHAAKLDRLSVGLLSIGSTAAMNERLFALSEATYEFNIKRGLYVEVDPSEIRPPPLPRGRREASTPPDDCDLAVPADAEADQ